MKTTAGIALLLLVATRAIAVFPDKPTTGYKAVGMIGNLSSTGFSQNGCGVAISPQWVIGVSHVGGKTFVQEGRQYPIVQKIISKVATGEPADLALYKLGKPVPEFATVKLLPYEGAVQELKNRTVFLVGYGRTATLRRDGLGWEPMSGSEGIRRVTTNRIDQVGSNRYNIGSGSDPKWKNSVCLGYDLDKPGDPSKSTIGSVISNPEGGIAAKDSGGGWFVKLGNQDYLVAVSATVGRVQGSSLPNDYSFGAQGFGVHLYAYKDWIYSVTGISAFGPLKVASRAALCGPSALLALASFGFIALKTSRR